MMAKKVYEVVAHVDGGKDYKNMVLVDPGELGEKTLEQHLLEKYKEFNPEEAGKITSIRAHELIFKDLDYYGYKDKHKSNQSRSHLHDCEIVDAISYDHEKMELVFVARISLATFSGVHFSV